MRPCVKSREALRQDRGFTLLEVLVAFIIAALALAALTQGAASGLRSVRVSGHVQEAVSRARSRLAAIGHGVPLQPGDQEGDDGGGFRWRLRVAPAATTERSERNEPRPVLYDVAMTIEWRMDGGVRQVALSTQRLGSAPPEPP